RRAELRGFTAGIGAAIGVVGSFEHPFCRAERIIAACPNAKLTCRSVEEDVTLNEALRNVLVHAGIRSTSEGGDAKQQRSSTARNRRRSVEESIAARSVKNMLDHFEFLMS